MVGARARCSGMEYKWFIMYFHSKRNKLKRKNIFLYWIAPFYRTISRVAKYRFFRRYCIFANFIYEFGIKLEFYTTINQPGDINYFMHTKLHTNNYLHLFSILLLYLFFILFLFSLCLSFDFPVSMALWMGRENFLMYFQRIHIKFYQFRTNKHKSWTYAKAYTHPIKIWRISAETENTSHESHSYWMRKDLCVRDQ